MRDKCVDRARVRVLSGAGRGRDKQAFGNEDQEYRIYMYVHAAPRASVVMVVSVESASTYPRCSGRQLP